MSTNTVALWDYDYQGRYSSSNLTYHENENAVQNALLLWANTRKGEVLNNPNSGGSLEDEVFKNFGVNSQLELLFRFRSNLDNRFFPRINIMAIDIEQNLSIRQWGIILKYYINDFKTVKNTNIPLTKIDIKSAFTEPDENIAYTGDTLINFIRIYLYD